MKSKSAHHSHLLNIFQKMPLVIPQYFTLGYKRLQENKVYFTNKKGVTYVNRRIIEYI